MAASRITSKLLYSIVQAIVSPITIFCIFSSTRIYPAYKFSAWKKLRLGYRFFFNRLLTPTATSPKVAMAMALKILEIPPEEHGVVVEARTYKGGTAANLSLVCKLVGRQLVVFDSFDGLPEAPEGDREKPGYKCGEWKGTLDEVKRNISRCGAIEVCTFVQGWFEDTLPRLTQDVVAAYLDVDLESSLDTCVRHIWPRLTPNGLIFSDECGGTNYCSLFYSERWWRENFNRTPPGLIGAGTGLPLGDFYVGPVSENGDRPLHHASTGAYTSKKMSGYWSYYPKAVTVPVLQEADPDPASCKPR